MLYVKNISSSYYNYGVLKKRKLAYNYPHEYVIFLFLNYDTIAVRYVCNTLFFFFSIRYFKK